MFTSHATTLFSRGHPPAGYHLGKILVFDVEALTDLKGLEDLKAVTELEVTRIDDRINGCDLIGISSDENVLAACVFQYSRTQNLEDLFMKYIES